MEIKDLNKTQLILLSVLISFVTSIATGITTVALMEQAPPSIIQPINRIVRQTVEKIVPGEEKVVIIKEEDVLGEMVAKTKLAGIEINCVVKDKESEIKEEIINGFFISKGGLIISSAGRDTELNDCSFNLKDKKIILVANKNSVFNFYLWNKKEEGEIKISNFLNIEQFKNLQLGQILIVFKDNAFNIAKGIISNFSEIEIKKEGLISEEVEASEKVKIIDTEIDISNIADGSLFLNSEGKISGMVISQNEKKIILNSDFLRNLVASSSYL